MRRALFVAVSLSLAAGLSAADGDAPKKPKVKLAVLVVFDQMRGDFVEKWRPQFGDDGFQRLQNDGAWFTDCHYPYGSTSTAPGHASILAGCGPDIHGIVNNDWFDRATALPVYSVGSTRYELVPPKALDEPEIDPKAPNAKPRPAAVVGNPDRFVGPTLADVLKESTGGKGKVFGLSLKDRSAILPSGRKPDGAYWFNGRFVTSTYYRDSLPAWVAAFNDGGLAQSYHGKAWERSRPDLDYDALAGPDDAPGEGTGPSDKRGQPGRMGKTFPHPMTGGKPAVSAAYYQDMVTSPYGNDLLLAFAKECVVAEKLGQRDAPDLLTVSFSSNDLVGHAWGPDSHEVLDITLRSDRVMADLLKFLDAKVGPGNYAVVVTADHGICPIHEVSAAKGLDAKRIPPLALMKAAEAHLRATYGQANPGAEEPKPDAAAEAKPADPKAERNLWVEAVSAPSVYLNQRRIKAQNLDPAAVAETLAAFLRTQPGINRAYTQAQLAAKEGPKGDALFAPMRRSFMADRSGDVIVVAKPLDLFDTYATGTSHGSPHPYDTHTAFLVYGPGVGGGKREEKVTPLHAAAIVADFLGVNPPRNNQYALPATLAKP